MVPNGDNLRVADAASASERPRVSVWALQGEAASNATPSRTAVTANPFSIGRSSKNDLCLSDPTVSGRHAELVELADSFLVRDLDSTNGTFLNGRRVERHEIVGPNDVLQFGAVAYRLVRTDGGLNATPSHASSCTVASDVATDAVAFVQFEKMLAERAVVPHFQPIVTPDGSRVAYEILGRSRLFGLESPAAMFRTATRLQSEVALSRMLRQEGVRAASELAPPTRLFVNTHPTELIEPGLAESIWALRAAFPGPELVLEVHEAAATDLTTLRSLTESLREIGVGIAYDDFGAGQSRLMELTDVLPDYVKFDIGLIRDIDTANAQRQGVVRSLVKMVRDLGVTTLAEGVETEAEAETCWEMGFELAQGYLYGRPAPANDWND